MQNERFHHTPEGFLELADRSINKAMRDHGLTKEDAHLIREFVEETAAANRISASRYYKLINTLTNLRRFTPAFKDCAAGDLYQAVRQIQNYTKPDGKHFTNNTQSDYIKIGKRLFQWMAENGYTTIPKEKIDKIRPPAYSIKTKTEAAILSEDEIKALIDVPRSVRYRAIISLMYEGGFRASEVGLMQWQDVTFERWGAIIKTSGKTGKPRTVPIIAYREYLAQWRLEYPGTPEGENLVFLNMHRKPLQYFSLNQNLARFAKEAGITKKVTPHILRHSRLTHLLRSGLHETIAKKTFWGTAGTKMIACYEHLTDRDNINAIAALGGVEMEEDTKELGRAIRPVQCPNCMKVNPPGALYCIQCGLKLSKEAEDRQNVAVNLIELILDQPGGPELLNEAMARKRQSSN